MLVSSNRFIPLIILESKNSHAFHLYRVFGYGDVLILHLFVMKSWRSERKQILLPWQWQELEWVCQQHFLLHHQHHHFVENFDKGSAVLFAWGGKGVLNGDRTTREYITYLSSFLFDFYVSFKKQSFVISLF